MCPLGLRVLICEVMGLNQASGKGLPPRCCGSKSQLPTGKSGEEFHMQEEGTGAGWEEQGAW